MTGKEDLFAWRGSPLESIKRHLGGSERSFTGGCHSWYHAVSILSHLLASPLNPSPLGRRGIAELTGRPLGSGGAPNPYGWGTTCIQPSGQLVTYG